MKTITSELLSSLNGFSYTGKPDDVLVEKAEAELGLRFAEDYKALTAQYGAISFRGHNFSGISPFPGNNVVLLTKEHRSYNDSVPNTFYVLEEAHIDGIVIWQTVTGEVFQTQYGTVEVKLLYKSLFDYIEACK